MKTLEFLKIWIRDIVQVESIVNFDAIFFREDEIKAEGHYILDKYYNLDRLDYIYRDEEKLVFDFELGIVVIKRDKQNICFNRKDGQQIIFADRSNQGACDIFADYLRKNISFEEDIELKSWMEYQKSLV